MNLLHHHHFLVPSHFRNRNPCLINQNHSHWCLGRGVSVSVLRRKSNSVPAAVPVPARDRVIDFGKYKGKMLGSVPSSYLKWVSNNLRVEEWANLAEQVLRDPIYRDRIEWEFALNILTGNSSNNYNYLSSSLRPTSTAVSELLEEISERFGWDNLDKVGWSQVDFDLLGTSKGGRIPRLVNLMDTQPNPKPKPKPKPKHHPPAALSLSGSAQWERRMERRERQKMRFRRTETEAQQQKKKNKNINIIDGKDEIDEQKQNQNQNQNGIANPFPGRQALLRSATRKGHKVNHPTRTTFVS